MPEDAFIVIAAGTAPALSLPPVALPSPSGSVAIGLYIKTSPGRAGSLQVALALRYNTGEWVRLEPVTWKVADEWAIYGRCVQAERPVTEALLEITGAEPNTALFLWGYSAGAFRDLAPDVERDIRDNDPDVDEELLQRILRNVREQRFEYFESAELRHDNSALASLGLAPSSGAVTCKSCSLCERLLPIVSFHRHARFASGYQQECRACKNCNINPKLNYRRTKQQLLESALIRRELECLASENLFLRSHPNFIEELFERFGNQCFNCNTVVNRTTGHVDHTRPLVALWPLDEHATLLCTRCNNEKHDKFPVEFYRDPEKRRMLAAITGLSLAEVEAVRMNPTVLAKVTRDVGGWYEELQASAAGHEDVEKVRSIPDRSFRAVARRASELEGIDLYALYEAQEGVAFPGER